jgi:hypothetical protein
MINSLSCKILFLNYSIVQVMFVSEFGLIFRSPKELSGHAQEDQPVLPSVSVPVFYSFPSMLCCHAEPDLYLFVVFVRSSYVLSKILT